jgi:hypothetical protein
MQGWMGIKVGWQCLAPEVEPTYGLALSYGGVSESGLRGLGITRQPPPHVPDVKRADNDKQDPVLVDDVQMLKLPQPTARVQLKSPRFYSTVRLASFKFVQDSLVTYTRNQLDVFPHALLGEGTITEGKLHLL